MPTSIYRLRLLYSAAPDGESWSISSYNTAADPDACLDLADVFNSKYLAVCNERVKIVQLAVSKGDITPGVEVVYPGADFTVTIGSGLLKMVPVGEYLKAEGVEPNSFVGGRSLWHLHGIDTNFLAATGLWSTGGADMIALKVAAQAYLMNYREEETSVRHWPIVTPPQPFSTFNLADKPFMRRLGRSFNVPGQTQRYQRHPTPSP